MIDANKDKQHERDHKNTGDMAGFLEEFGCKDWYEWGKLYAGVAQDAWKYHDLMNANAQVVKDNINITKEHQIVVEVKNRIDIYSKEKILSKTAQFVLIELQDIIDGKRLTL